MTILYFAYGSNMLTARLTARCDSAIPTGIAYAENRVIEFSKRGIDGSGKATLRRATGERTPGVLFEIPKTQLGLLDRAEGVGNGYERYNKIPIQRPDGARIVPVTTYLATSREPKLRPYDWYLALVLAGAYEHGLRDDHLAALSREAYLPDPDVDRQSRREAVQALDEAGWPDYRKVLACP